MPPVPPLLPMHCSWAARVAPMLLLPMRARALLRCSWAARAALLLTMLPLRCSWAARVAPLLLLLLLWMRVRALLLLPSMRTRTPLPMHASMARVEPLLLLLPMWARALLDCCSY